MSLHLAGDGVVVSHKRLGTASVLVVRGCVDVETVHVLREHVDAALRGPGDVVVDLSDIAFFSSAGALALASEGKRGRLHVVVTPVVREVLHRVGVAGSVRLYEFPADAEEAAASSRPLLLVG